MTQSFYINLPVGGVSLAIILRYFKTPKAANPTPTPLKQKLINMDLIGTFTIMVALICILLVMQWGGVTKSWSSPDVIGTLIGFVLLTVLFVANEIWQGEQALMVPRLMKQRTIATCCLYVFL